MDNMLKQIAEMSDERQAEVFKELNEKLGEETTNFLRERVFYIKLFTNKSFYNEVVEKMGAELYKELTA